MATPQAHNHHTTRNLKIALIVLAVILAILVLFLFREYRSLRRAQVLGAREAWLRTFVKHHGYLTAADTGLIRPWMTFDYVNKTFSLPAEYLKNQLRITDTHYPKISISGYAKTQHINTTTFLNSVADAVHAYVTTK